MICLSRAILEEYNANCLSKLSRKTSNIPHLGFVVISISNISIVASFFLAEHFIHCGRYSNHRLINSPRYTCKPRNDWISWSKRSASTVMNIIRSKNRWKVKRIPLWRQSTNSITHSPFSTRWWLALFSFSTLSSGFTGERILLFQNDWNRSATSRECHTERDWKSRNSNEQSL